MRTNYTKKGNSKISKTCGIFNLPTHVCKTQCKNCYARKAEKLYPNVLPSRNKNLEFTKTENFVSGMIADIQASKVKIYRIHESGDFYSQEYIFAWFKIITALPHIQFYAYTKAVLDFNCFDKLDNMNLIYSTTPIGLNYGNEEYCTALKNDYDYTICPCKKGAKIECMKDCTVCLTTKKVCFLEH